ncbi:MAG: hypothetical protein K0U41_01970, partial [Gammaproteobacteria bacterium]|nr:hypothetical protein [Gammaproteobacteria bacterium]
MNTKKPKNIMILPFIVTHIVAKTMQNMQTIKQTAIVTATAVLLVACGGGGGGGSSTAGPSVSAFSHSAYTFAPNIAGNKAIGISSEQIGRVFPNDNVIRGLVAARLGETDPQKISALATGTSYRVSYSIDAVAGSSTTTFFSIDAATGAIEVSNPAGVGSGLTYDEIRAFVGNSITVKLTITVINPQPSASTPGPHLGPNLGDPIESSVRVNLLNADAAITDTTRGNVLSYNRGAVSFANSTVSEIDLKVEGTLNENNQLSADIPISGFANNPATSAIINRYSITRNDPQSAVTIFYGLRTPTDEECANGAVYIDNNDLRIKAGTAFDYETDTRIYNCRLAASVDGVDYYPLAFVVNDNAGTEVDSLPARQDDIFQIKDQANSANGCSGTDTACYYGDVTITIDDVNEAPTVELVGGGSNFDGSNEGVGVLSTYISVATGAYSGILATDGAKVDAINLRINDED